MSGRLKPKHRPGLGFRIESETPQPVVIAPPNIHATTTVIFDDLSSFELDGNDLESLGSLGRGAYGDVERMRHRPSGKIMAVKRITYAVNSEEQKRLLMDVEVNMKTGKCVYAVKFYGALFREGDVWICMELMDMSLDKFVERVYKLNKKIAEPILGKIAFSVVSALHYLKAELNVMHRDVKPSNILIDKVGHIKICDYGISGQLVDSVAKTMNVGCKPYMGPERINPEKEGKGYDVRSDVWSLGISMIELATGKFPYDRWKNPFQQLKQVVEDPSPQLPAGEFSDEFDDFVKQCLNKDYRQRPTYDALLRHPFILNYADEDISNVAQFFSEVLDAQVDNSSPSK